MELERQQSHSLCSLRKLTHGRILAVCHYAGWVIELVVRENVFTYPRQFVPGIALYDVGKVRTVPAVPVSEIPAVRRAPADVCVLTEFAVNALSRLYYPSQSIFHPKMCFQ